jgi:hypothetical protein
MGGWPWRLCMIIQQKPLNNGIIGAAAKRYSPLLPLVEVVHTTPLTNRPNIDGVVPRAPVGPGPCLQPGAAGEGRTHVGLHCHPAGGSLTTRTRTDIGV